MAFLDPSIRSIPADDGLFREVAIFCREFAAAIFDPYQPERHYMRGPGPAWLAKHEGAVPRVRSTRPA